MNDDEDDEDDEDDDNESVYPNVDITIRISNSEGDPIEGLRVSLQPTYSFSGGFIGELVTDSDGEVTFSVRSWRTYTLWLDHARFDEIGVSGGSETFQFTWS